MKKAATIFILVILVSIQTPVGQLFKLPILIEHFMKHQQQQGVSLFSFLEEHYASEHKDKDLPEDQQLPFKSIVHYSIGNAIVTPFSQPCLPASMPAERKIIFTGFYTPQQHLASIFHPPKV